MKLFGKRKQDKAQPGKDKIARGIAGFILKVQNSFATFMGKRTSKLSAGSMKVGLIIFLVAGSGLSIYFVVTAVVQKGAPKVMKIDRVHVPRYYDRNGGESAQPPGFVISQREHEAMQGFLRYMDSLRESKGGRRVYDSILVVRPGLLDSVKMLEEFYQSQLQHKK